MPVYDTLIQLNSESALEHAPAFFERQPEKFVSTTPEEGGVWFRSQIEAASDEKAGEWVYNLLTRFEMHLSMKAGRDAKNDPLDEGIVLLLREGRMVLMAGCPG